MTYGLRLTGKDGATEFEVFDTDTEAAHMIVMATGSGTSVDIDSASYGGSGGTKILLFKPIGTRTTVDRSGSVYNFKRYTTTEDGSGNKTDATVINQSVSWILLRDVPSAPINATMGTYGMLCYKADGTTEIFNSKKLQVNESWRLLNIVPQYTVSGDDEETISTFATYDSTATTLYVDADNCQYEDAGSSGECMGFTTAGSGASVEIRLAHFYWSYTGGGGRQDRTYYRPNNFPITYGELR